jgi:hypothetical protein
MTPSLTTTSHELAHRSGNGIDVTLVWVRRGGVDETVVRVTDHRKRAYFEIPAEADRALDVYDHPFAYRDLSTVDSEASRPAA